MVTGITDNGEPSWEEKQKKKEEDAKNSGTKPTPQEDEAEKKTKTKTVEGRPAMADLFQGLGCSHASVGSSEAARSKDLLASANKSKLVFGIFFPISWIFQTKVKYCGGRVYC